MLTFICSVVGLNFDFVILNFTKHSSYLIFNAAMFFSPTVQKQYHQKYGSDEVRPRHSQLSSIWQELDLAKACIHEFLLSAKHQPSMLLPFHQPGPLPQEVDLTDYGHLASTTKSGQGAVGSSGRLSLCVLQVGQLGSVAHLLSPPRPRTAVTRTLSLPAAHSRGPQRCCLLRACGSPYDSHIGPALPLPGQTMRRFLAFLMSALISVGLPMNQNRECCGGAAKLHQPVVRVVKWASEIPPNLSTFLCSTCAV
jgi:hypothetical protein